MVRLPPPLLALAAGVAQRALTGSPAAPGPARVGVSAVVALASVTLAGASVGGFRRVGTTVEPFRPERASVLVTTGVNSVTRNPMYLGLAGVLVAHAIWRDSWAALVPVAGFVALIDRTQIQAEETALQARFGSEYDAYRAATPRWIGLASVPHHPAPRSSR